MPDSFTRQDVHRLLMQLRRKDLPDVDMSGLLWELDDSTDDEVAESGATLSGLLEWRVTAESKSLGGQPSLYPPCFS